MLRARVPVHESQRLLHHVVHHALQTEQSKRRMRQTPLIELPDVLAGNVHHVTRMVVFDFVDHEIVVFVAHDLLGKNIAVDELRTVNGSLVDFAGIEPPKIRFDGAWRVSLELDGLGLAFCALVLEASPEEARFSGQQSTVSAVGQNVFALPDAERDHVGGGVAFAELVEASLLVRESLLWFGLGHPHDALNTVIEVFVETTQLLSYKTNDKLKL